VRYIPAILIVLVFTTILGLFIADQFLVFRTWRRHDPLASPIRATVKDGALNLEDGRTMIPAGIAFKPEIPPEERDCFLTAAIAQGVDVIRDLGDGRAFLRVEPRFCNWCGTSRTWAGSYVQAPLSELLIACGYADPDATQTGITPDESWRLAGTAELFDPIEPRGFNADATAPRYDADVHWFAELDVFIEAVYDVPRPDQR
jgi:hypothetical protein